jgi:hypothetical protein
VEKYCTAGQATEENLVHAHCMLETCGYEHVLRICNTYSFSTAAVLHYIYIACLVAMSVLTIVC